MRGPTLTRPPRAVPNGTNVDTGERERLGLESQDHEVGMASTMQTTYGYGMTGGQAKFR